MTMLELTHLDEHLEAAEIELLEATLAESGSGPLDLDDTAETQVLTRSLDEDLVAEVMDRLEAHEAAADIYVPPRFEEVFEIGGFRIGSAAWLGDVLEELRDELVDEDEGGEFDAELDELEEDASAYTGDEEPDAFQLKEAQMQEVWKMLYTGARQAVKKGLALVVRD